MPNYKAKPCAVCGEMYMPTGHCSKYCPTCGAMKMKEWHREGQLRYRERKGLPVHVGKGGSNKRYKEHPQYSSGMGNFHALRKQMFAEIHACQWCGKDLTNAGRYEKCVHHLDHNRSNNDRENLVLICKRCHQIHHECHKAFQGSVRCNDHPILGVGESRTPKRTAPVQ